MANIVTVTAALHHQWQPI